MKDNMTCATLGAWFVLDPQLHLTLIYYSFFEFPESPDSVFEYHFRIISLRQLLSQTRFRLVAMAPQRFSAQEARLQA